MASAKLSKMELQIMNALWNGGECSIREIQESFPEGGRPAFSTIQTMVYRLEAKEAVRCTKRVGKANIFAAVITRKGAMSKTLDDLLALFGGRPVMAHMVKTGHLTLDDVKEAEDELRKLSRKGKSK